MAKKPKKKKSEEATVAARVEEVLRIRLDGAQFHDVLQYASEKRWGLTDRQVRTYMRRADDLLVERREKSRKRLLAQHLARRETLYARCVNAADYRSALAMLDSSARMQGLFPDPKELKELAKLTLEQAAKIAEFENRIPDAAAPIRES